MDFIGFFDWISLLLVIGIFIWFLVTLFQSMGDGGQSSSSEGGGLKGLAERITGFKEGMTDLGHSLGMGSVANERKRLKDIRDRESKLMISAADSLNKIDGTDEKLKVVDLELFKLVTILSAEAKKPSQDRARVLSEANNLFSQIINLLKEIHDYLKTANSRITLLVQTVQEEENLEKYLKKITEIQEKDLKKLKAKAGVDQALIASFESRLAAADAAIKEVLRRVRIRKTSEGINQVQMLIQSEMDQLQEMINILTTLQAEITAKSGSIELNTVGGTVYKLRTLIQRLREKIKSNQSILANYRDIMGRDQSVLDQFDKIIEDVDKIAAEIKALLDGKKGGGGGGGKTPGTWPIVETIVLNGVGYRVELYSTLINIHDKNKPTVKVTVDKLRNRTLISVEDDIKKGCINLGISGDAFLAELRKERIYGFLKQLCK